MSKEKIAIVGLGYVGLPVALAIAEHYPGTYGFDLNPKKIEDLRSGLDRNFDVDQSRLKASSLVFTSNPEDLKGSTFFVVAVPTPVDKSRKPDLAPLIAASKMVGKLIKKGALIVFESTVYPGVSEEICAPIIEQNSGLRSGIDFKIGYSPERINPGDQEHTLERVVKVVSAQDSESLARVSRVYSSIIRAGIHQASSIKVAEAAKVIENTQRDLNIALMNELALIFDRIGISTREVLDAAATKWNFLRFNPGLVGGHCIGVDPYYLTWKAEELGYRPQVILAGRRINDGMGQFVAQKIVKLMIQAGLQIKGARVGILGLTFKENVSDIRNSRVPDICKELKEFGVVPIVHDPLADPNEAQHEYGIELSNWEQLRSLNGLVYAVSHNFYCKKECAEICSLVHPGGVLVDVKAQLKRSQVPANITYWGL